MNIKTFYTIYYRHRIQKANLLLKIYILLILPFRYLLNIPFLPKKINLDEHSNSNVELFKKDLDYLFEYFNSDKGNYYINQYMQPIKKKNKRIDAHGYSKIYERYFEKIRNANLNVLELGSFYGNAAGALVCHVIALFYVFQGKNLYSSRLSNSLQYIISLILNMHI